MAEPLSESNLFALIVELISVCRIKSQFSLLNSLSAEKMYRNWEKHMEIQGELRPVYT